MTLPPDAHAVVLARSGGRCELCRRPAGPGAGSYSHRIPASLGGPVTPGNGIRTCGSGTTGCHGWLEAHPRWAAEGHWQLRHDTPTPPEQVPVWLAPATLWPGWWFIGDPLIPDGYIPAADADPPTHLPPWATE